MEKERNIDLIDLVCFVLSGWKLLLLAGVLGFVLLGGFRIYRLNLAKGNVNTDPAPASKEELSYNRDVNDLAAKSYSLELQQKRVVELEQSRKQVAGKISKMVNYLDQSVLMQIDPNAVAEAKRTYRITAEETDTEESFDPIYDFLNAYSGEIRFEEDTTGIVEKTGIDAVYLNELVRVSYDGMNSDISVTALGTDEAMAKEILAAACVLFENRKEDVTKSFGKHSILCVGEQSGIVVDSMAGYQQQEKYNELKELNDQMKLIDKEVLEAEEAIPQLQSDTEELTLRLKGQTDPRNARLNAATVMTKADIRSGIKYGILGAVVAVIVLAGIFFLVYIFNGRIHTAADMGDYFRLSVLAVLARSSGKGGCRFSCRTGKQRDGGTSRDDEAKLQAAAVRIRKLMTGGKKIGLMTTLDQETCEKGTAAISAVLNEFEVIAIPDSAESAEGGRQLGSVDAVVVFEKRDVSKTEEIEKELRQAELFGIKVLGCILA